MKHFSNTHTHQYFLQTHTWPHTKSPPLSLTHSTLLPISVDNGGEWALKLKLCSLQLKNDWMHTQQPDHLFSHCRRLLLSLSYLQSSLTRPIYLYLPLTHPFLFYFLWPLTCLYVLALTCLRLSLRRTVSILSWSTSTEEISCIRFSRSASLKSPMLCEYTQTRSSFCRLMAKDTSLCHHNRKS